ncbi:hypothetical protein BBJ28_00023408 [Nothophytophthora sp. Chile5]|nr:hypothetical protein BBJ28_00023408 [Nothophytophthora sp. Chile5]
MDGDVLPAKGKKGSKFIDAHLSRFGLKIGTRNQQTQLVETVVCRFCLAFGKEDDSLHENASSKPRRQSTTPKHFNRFRTELFEGYMKRMHPLKWHDYTTLTTDEEKSDFFSSPPVPYVATMQAAFGSEGAIQLTIKPAIINTIIGDLLFHPDDLEGVPHARAMAIFTDEGKHFMIDEKNPSRFRLCVRFMSRGASFHMAAALVNDTKEETGIGRFGGCSDAVAARYARYVCAASLQDLSMHLGGVWAFSLALDCATHQGRSYTDVRCRFSLLGRLFNFHLLAIPLYNRHTAANIFNAVTKFMDALVPSWRHQLLGVATDGAATMVGNTNGVTTRLEQAAAYPIKRVWCGLHQLDLKMQIVFDNALNESYLGTLKSLIGYLRRQQNLITEMRTTCPKVADTRWLSMYQVTKWLCSNGFRVREYLVQTAAPCSPNTVWWVFLYALREISREANAVFVSLQGRGTLIQQ